MEKRYLHRDTKALLLGLAIVVLVGLGVGIWGYFTGAFEISASFSGRGILKGAAKVAGSGTPISGVLVRWGTQEPKQECTTGSNGECQLPATYRLGQYRAEFTKNGYAPDPAVVSQYCSMSGGSCTLTAWLTQAKPFSGKLYKLSNGVSSPACMTVIKPGTTGGCTVTINMTPNGSKTWKNVGRTVGSQTYVSVPRYLSPGSYQITGGTLVGGDGTSYHLEKVEGKTLPYSFTMGTQSITVTYTFSK